MTKITSIYCLHTLLHIQQMRMKNSKQIIKISSTAYTAEFSILNSKLVFFSCNFTTSLHFSCLLLVIISLERNLFLHIHFQRMRENNLNSWSRFYWFTGRTWYVVRIFNTFLSQASLYIAKSLQGRWSINLSKKLLSEHCPQGKVVVLFFDHREKWL